ncbi:hypothetical protein OHA51_23000 [Streptomyces sp. NBC_00589]|nr:hypothetical protein [Streptomyces sp. NBC_00589]WTI38327.1 hypothetical protein OIC96_26735 [Streptomyces sp. NBC_00775]WUB27994.1 hypothetical protein OHA51_23000 [Streptomyces sp. NBC_00589]
MPMLGILLLLVCSAAATAALFAVARVMPLAKRKPNNEVLGFVYAQVGVIYAVVLAMVVVGVWESRSQAHENTYTETNALLQIAWFSTPRQWSRCGGSSPRAPRGSRRSTANRRAR